MKIGEHGPSQWFCIEVRHEQNLTQEGMAKKFKVGVRTIQHWEHGRNPPSHRYWMHYIKLSSHATLLEFHERLQDKPAPPAVPYVQPAFFATVTP